jgi:hypothetical protein
METKSRKSKFIPYMYMYMKAQRSVEAELLSFSTSALGVCL